MVYPLSSAYTVEAYLVAYLMLHVADLITYSTYLAYLCYSGDALASETKFPVSLSKVPLSKVSLSKVNVNISSLASPLYPPAH